MQAGEPDARLGLHARRAEHRDTAVVCDRHGVSQQSRLADPGLTAQYECAAAASDPVQQRRDPRDLRSATEKRDFSARRVRHERDRLTLGVIAAPGGARRRSAPAERARTCGLPRQTSTAREEVASTALWISATTAPGCESAIECEASTSTVCARAR
jgi:hypothetical protein